VKNKLQLIRILFLKSLLIVFLSLLFITAFAPDMKVVYIRSAEPVDAYDRLIKAIVQVESAGDTLAYNQTEEATGAFQIRPIRLLDYYQRTGVNYKIEDCYDYDISKLIFLYYARHTGHRDYETIARNWNGSGELTLDYWNKVKAIL
jgi:hypothetical protein